MNDHTKRDDAPDIEVDPLPACFHMNTRMDLETQRMTCMRCGQVFVPEAIEGELEEIKKVRAELTEAKAAMGSYAASFKTWTLATKIRMLLNQHRTYSEIVNIFQAWGRDEHGIAHEPGLHIVKWVKRLVDEHRRYVERYGALEPEPSDDRPF